MDSVLNNLRPMIQKFINLDPVDQEEHLESAEVEANESRHKCLNILLIIRQLVKHVSNAELIKLSTINKQWNFEALCEMRDRGCFTAHLKSAHPCEDLVALASLMPTLSVIPFAGISMDLNANDVCTCSMVSTEQLAFIHDQILDELLWKKISVKLAGNFNPDMKCPALQLFIQVLQKFSQNIEGLSIHIDPYSVSFLKKIIQNSNFARLKTLRYDADETKGNFYNDHRGLIQAFVSRAGQKPLELRMNTYMGNMTSTLEGATVDLVADYEFNLIIHVFPLSFIHKLKLTNLTLNFDRLDPPLNFERLDAIVLVLLSSSRTLLRRLHVNLPLLMPFMRYGRTFKNLTSLSIELGLINQEPEQPEIVKLLQAFDFRQIFPRLETLDVCLYSCSSVRYDINQLVERSNFICSEPKQDGVANIKHLAISSSSSTSEHSGFPCLAQVFPHIDRLSLQTYRTWDWSSLFAQILMHWPNIKHLEVRALLGKYILSEDRGSVETINENLDSEFCGIFPEEVAELRKMDDEYLKAVNVVPVMPSVTCLRGLRTFKMVWRPNCYPFGKDDATFLFSKVASLLVFARRRDLCVTLETESGPLARALTHMKPYVPVVLDEFRWKFDHI